MKKSGGVIYDVSLTPNIPLYPTNSIQNICKNNNYNKANYDDDNKNIFEQGSIKTSLFVYPTKMFRS